MQTEERGETEVISVLRLVPEPELLRALQQALHSELPQVQPQVPEQVLPSTLQPLLVLVTSSEPRPLSVSAY